MKYILTFILIIFFSACSKNTKPKDNHIAKENNNNTKIQKSDITIINFDNFQLKFKKNNLIYPKEKTIINVNNFVSKAKYSPFEGSIFQGKIVDVIYAGKTEKQ